MAQNNRRFVLARNLLLLAGLGFAAGPTARYMKEFAASDPFKAMMAGADKEPGYALKMEGVQFRHYDDGKLVTDAKCDVANLRQDHHTYDLTNVHDALYQGDDGKFRYSAQHAVYVDGANVVDANGTVHVTSSDLDLHARALQFVGDTHRLAVFGKVTGKVKGGDTQADNVVYHTDTGAYSAGPVKWQGKLALSLQDPDDTDKPHPWEIEGADVSFSGKGTEIATYTNAVAADGEVILIAPKVEHNRRTDVVTATGRVQYFSGRANLVADQCVVYRKEKRAVLTGNVLMLVKAKKNQDDKPKVEALPPYQPKNPDQVVATPIAKITDQEKDKANQVRESKSIRDYPTVMVGDKIEYWYSKGSRRAVITGAPQARQELPDSGWRYVWTNVAYYDGEAETLKLVSSKDLKDTRMKNSIGDDCVADWMQVSTQEDNDEMSAKNLKGTVMSLSEDEVPGKGKSGAPKSDKVIPPPPTKTTGGGQ